VQTLLDSEILADVYLVMTGGQTALSLDAESSASAAGAVKRAAIDVSGLRVVAPDEAELAAHEVWLQRLADEAEGGCVWRKL